MKLLLLSLALIASASAQAGVFQCETVSGETSGFVQSRGYPNDYPNNENCNSLITVTAGAVLGLTFEVLDTEDGFDYVTLHDGANAQAPILAELSGHVAPTNRFRASSNQLYVSFTSDFSIPYSGFSAFFEETVPLPQFQCVDVMGADADNGEITSRNFPNNYPINDVCESTITVDEGVVTLEFNLVNTETTDVITVHDGADASGPVLARVSGTTIPARIRSTGPSIFVSFVEDGSGIRQGFRAEFQKTIPLERFMCMPVTLMEGGAAELASPNWPGNYPNGADCGSLVTGPADSVITFKFDELNIEPNVDFVDLYDGVDATATRIAHVSATTPPGTTYRSTGNVMFVHFNSDDSGVRQGFLATVREA